MQAFSFDISNENKQYRGELFQETGTCAGVSTTTTTTTKSYKNGHEKKKTSVMSKINVRMPSGKIRTINAKGDRYIPGGVPVTLFFSDAQDMDSCAYYYNHNDNELQYTKPQKQKAMRHVVFGWSAMRRLHALTVDVATGLAGFALGAMAGVWTNTHWDWGVLAFLTFFFSGVLATLGVSYPAKWLGGGIWIHHSIEGPLHNMLREQAKQCLAQSSNSKSAPGFIAGNELEGGLSEQTPAEVKVESQTVSASSDGDFKPMF